MAVRGIMRGVNDGPLLTIGSTHKRVAVPFSALHRFLPNGKVSVCVCICAHARRRVDVLFSKRTVPFSALHRFLPNGKVSVCMCAVFLCLFSFACLCARARRRVDVLFFQT